MTSATLYYTIYAESPVIADNGHPADAVMACTCVSNIEQKQQQKNAIRAFLTCELELYAYFLVLSNVVNIVCDTTDDMRPRT